MKVYDGRIMALDWGQKRIGIDLSDLSHTIATAFDVLELKYAKDESWLPRLKTMIAKEEVIEVIFGLPIHMDGSERTEAEWVREKGKQLQEATGGAVVFVDDRLSTVAAEKHLIGAGLSREKRKGVKDAVAAQLFLQMYLDSGGTAVS